jgi:hypothetical protein
MKLSSAPPILKHGVCVCGGGVSTLGPDRKQMWNVILFSLKFDSLTLELYDLLSREAAYNTIIIYQSIWPNLMWIHFAWTAQLTTTFSDNLENVFVLYCCLLAGNAQGHFFWPICLLLIFYLFLLLELFGNFTRRAFSGPSPLAIAYRQRLHLRT